MAMARRIATFLGAWRNCDVPICKRNHACCDLKMACAAKRPRSTPQQQARTAAIMYKALKRAIADKEKQRAEASSEPTKK